MHCEQCLLIFIDTGFYTCILSALMSGSACMPPICAVDTIVFSICPVVRMCVPSRATVDSSVGRAGRACQSNTHKLRWRHHLIASGLQLSSFCRTMLCKRGLCCHAVCVSVCLSVCLSRSYILSKLINASSTSFHRRVATPF